MYHEKITTRRELAENLADQLDFTSDEMTVYIDLTAQKIYPHVSVAMCGVSDAEYDGHEVVRMEGIDSDEAFGVMEDFARSRSDEQAQPLFKALSRSHPFKTFRYALEDTDQLDDWYAFKNKAYVDLAEAGIGNAASARRALARLEALRHIYPYRGEWRFNSTFFRSWLKRFS